MELFFSLRSYYIGICGIYFFNHQIIFLVFIFCFLGNYSNKGRLGFGSNPLSKNLQQKKGLNTCQYETNQQTSESNTIVASAASGHVFH